MDTLTTEILIFIGFLSTAAISKVVLKKIKLPFTVGLVIVGVLFGLISSHLSAFGFLSDLALTPDIILHLILPVLIFDAAINIKTMTLLKNIVPVLLLAVVGLLMSAAIIAIGLSVSTELSLIVALLFGALISATDPVAVIALFEEVGAPSRLTTLVDGESLFNDATAIVLFNIVLAIILQVSGSPDPSFFGIVGNFLFTLIGGLLVGSLIGFAGFSLLRYDKKSFPYIMTITLVVAYLSFILADELEVSGVMSTLAAGIILRHFSLRSETSTKALFVTKTLWEYVAFVANSIIFLLLGLTEFHLFQNTTNLLGTIGMLLIAIPLITVARAAAIYTLIPLYNKFTKHTPISKGYQLILLLGGLRGAVPVALVLAIPLTLNNDPFPFRTTVIHLTLGYILFTLLVQGTAMKSLMHKLGLKAEHTSFDHVDTVETVFEIPNLELGTLLYSQLLSAFQDGGYYASSTKVSSTSRTATLTQQEHLIEMALSTTAVTIVTTPQDRSYATHMLADTVGTLEESVRSLRGALEENNSITSLAQTEEVQGAIYSQGEKLVNHLSTSRILWLTPGTTEHLLYELIAPLAQKELLSDTNDILHGLMKREESLSTAMGEGVAIPHVRTNQVSQIEVVLGISEEGIEFNAPDKKPVHLFLLILSPQDALNDHIAILAAVSNALKNGATRDALIHEKSAEKILSILDA